MKTYGRNYVLAFILNLKTSHASQYDTMSIEEIQAF